LDAVGSYNAASSPAPPLLYVVAGFVNTNSMRRFHIGTP
jgi:hypothetical protein